MNSCNDNEQNVRIEKFIPFMPEEPMYANAYVPYQRMKTIYEPGKSLCRGTIFPELDLPMEVYMPMNAFGDKDCKCEKYCTEK